MMGGSFVTRRVELIIIHCSATPNGRIVTPDAIDRWHKRRGFHRTTRFRVAHNRHLTAFGYHFLIVDHLPIITGRHLDEVGAHARGYNQESIGICLAGTDKFSTEQWEKLRALVRGLLCLYPGARVIGHRDVNRHKECPCFDVKAWMDSGMEPASGHIYGT